MQISLSSTMIYFHRNQNNVKVHTVLALLLTHKYCHNFQRESPLPTRIIFKSRRFYLYSIKSLTLLTFLTEQVQTILFLILCINYVRLHQLVQPFPVLFWPFQCPPCSFFHVLLPFLPTSFRIMFPTHESLIQTLLQTKQAFIFS